MLIQCHHIMQLSASRMLLCLLENGFTQNICMLNQKKIQTSIHVFEGTQTKIITVKNLQ